MPPQFVPLALATAILVWIPWLQRMSERKISWSFLIGAACGAGSLLLSPQNRIGIALATVWFAACLIHAIRGGKQMLFWGSDHAGHLLKGVATILLVGGALWLLSTRRADPFLGFSDPWKTLTAIHFHYSGYLLTAVFALHWKRIARTCLYLSSVLIYLTGFIAVAIGLNGSADIERVGTGALVFAVFTLGWFILDFRRAKWLSIGIAITGVVSFSLALLFSWRTFAGLDLTLMIATHGILNAFVLMPLLLFYTQSRAETLPVRDFPLSRLKSSWRVGAEFFRGAVAGSATRKSGLLDSFDEFARSDFDAKRVNPQVRAFYEHTEDFSLSVKPAQHRAFRWIWRFIAKPFFHSIQQLDLPDREKDIHGEIHALRSEVDGRVSPRGWMRVDRATGRSIYAAAYAMHTTRHESRGVTYMNIAFPLPLANMTSVLHIEHFAETGIRLTTLRSDNPWGDQGVYLAIAGFGIRLPLNETIDVWYDGRLRARHQMWFCGWHYLTLDYEMDRIDIRSFHSN